MRASHFHLNTLRQAPAEAEIISHQLLLRAGMIRMEAAGIYTWLPLGLRVLRRVAEIVRQEMDGAGALEISMPIAQPAELWQESGRWEEYGPELQRFEDRRGRMFCLGPTHEEVVCALARDALKSYRDLPVNFYQIQTKYRGELRPRFGLMRCREFLMKDAYSFDLDAEGMRESYRKMRVAYCNIFDRLGLNYRVVAADSGSIGGDLSEEFQVLSESGEDTIVFSEGGQYAANLESAETLPPPAPEPVQQLALSEVATEGLHSIEAVCKALHLNAEGIVKLLLVRGASAEQPVIGLALRGDHRLNAIKAGNLPEVAAPLQMLPEEEIRQNMKAGPGSLGPVATGVPIIADRSAAVLANFCCGANKDGYHYLNANWGRDAEIAQTADLREVQAGEPSPAGDGALQVAKGIEVGHIFQLGNKYSTPMKVQVLDRSGRETVPLMGCYGIGVSRIVAAAIEQNHDDKGILWPEGMAPFQLQIIPLSSSNSEEAAQKAEEIYRALQAEGVQVLLDDRDLRPGIKLSDFELIGVPRALIVGARGLRDGQVEYRLRQSGEVRMLPVAEAATQLLKEITKPS